MMFLPVFTVLGAWCLFWLIIEYKRIRSCPFSTNISTRKFNSSSRYFSKHDFFTSFHVGVNEAKRWLDESTNRIANICSILCQVLPLEDYENIIRVTDTSKNTEYQNSKGHLKEKFQQLKSEKQKHSQIIWNNKRTIMKPAVLNLTGETINKNVTSLLNLGPNFFLTPTSIPYMEMITAIKSQALKLESGKKDTSPEKLRQMLVKSNLRRLEETIRQFE